MKQRLLPHYGERTIPVEMAVIHCSAFPLEKCVEIWDEYKVSPHYAIDENGEIIQLVDENQKAYHAGKGFWRGRRGDMNEGSIGVELVNMSLGQEPGSYPSAQIAALMILLQKLIKKYGISAQNIVGHSDIAPLRKADPGAAFPWEKLAQNGIGISYEMVVESYEKECSVKKLLSTIGYDTQDEETLIASAYAFRRHFLPDEVKIDSDIPHLLNNVYPSGDESLLQGERFISALQNISQVCRRLKSCSEQKYVDVIQRAR